MKVGILFSNMEFVRTWIDNGYLRTLTQNLSSQVSQSKPVILGQANRPDLLRALKERGLSVQEFSITVTPLMHLTYKMQFWAGTGLNDSLREQRDRFLFGALQPLPKNVGARVILRQLLRTSLHFVRVITLKPWSLLTLIPLGRRSLRLIGFLVALVPFRGLERQIERFEILVIPSVGFEKWITPLIVACKRKGVKVVIVPNNWDNLTSKNVFPVFPDAFVTMGKAMSLSLEKLGIPAAILRPDGLPKFTSFPSAPRTSLEPPLKILFLGFSVPYLEISTVNSIYSTLRRQESFNFSLDYKPHPLRLPRMVDDQELLGGIGVIEPHIHGDFDFQPIDDSYQSLLLGFDIVIAPPTTMIIEFVMAGRAQVILDLSDDKIHRTSPGVFAERWIHAKDLERLRLITGRSADEIAKQISDLVLGSHGCPPKVSEVVAPKPEGYAAGLASTIHYVYLKD